MAVVPLPHVSDALDARRLVTPLGIPSRRYESWYLAFRPVRSQEPALAWFRDWLRNASIRQMQLCAELGWSCEGGRSVQP